MSKFKFTDGEWRYTVSKNGRHQISANDQICMIWNNQYTKANAKIISHAPKMIKALINCYLTLETYKCDICNNTCERFDEGCDIKELKQLIESATDMTIKECIKAMEDEK
jgi:hypothetical protein